MRVRGGLSFSGNGAHRELVKSWHMRKLSSDGIFHEISHILKIEMMVVGKGKMV